MSAHYPRARGGEPCRGRTACARCSDRVTTATMATLLSLPEPREASAPADPVSDPTPPLVLVSHRGPLGVVEDADGTHLRRGGGGLVTALRDLVRHAPDAAWLCAATNRPERMLARGGVRLEATIADGAHCDVQFVAVDPEAHHDFYAVIANPLLWFVQHNLWDLACEPNITTREIDAWHHGYVRVNHVFAD